MAYAIMAILDGYAIVEESHAAPAPTNARKLPEMWPEPLLEEHTWTEPVRDVPPPAYTPIVPRPARQEKKS